VAIPSKLILTQKNDQIIEIDGLQDALTLAYVNNAVATATLKDSTGASVTGLTGVTLSYVSGSNGKYRGQVEETFSPALGNYVLHVDANSGGVVLHIEIKTSVKVRKS